VRSTILFSNEIPIPTKEKIFDLNPEISKLLVTFQKICEEKSHTGGVTIHVDEIASQIAKTYEKLRKIIDWKEENLLRRSAIERIIKRGLVGKISNISFLKNLDLNFFSEEMIMELIRGGHLENDSIPKEKIKNVKKIIEKYLFIAENTDISTSDIKKKINFYDWLMAIAACEIEDILCPPLEEQNLIETMTNLVNQRIKILPSSTLTPEEQKIQTYIATYRTLYDLDDSIISYNLIKIKYNEWSNPNKENLEYFVKNIFKIQEDLNTKLKHPLRKRFFNICEKYDTIFTILEDILKKYKDSPQDLNEVFNDKNKLTELVTEFYNIRYKSLKKRLLKLAIFSTLSVFVANWFTYFLVEIPLARIFYEKFNVLAAIIDFLVPSLAMFIIVSLIKPPGKDNLKELLSVIHKYVYFNNDKDIYEIKVKKKKGIITRFIILILYIIGFFISFGTIAWAYYKATLPITSVIFDTFTTAINVFAALVIRNKAREITIEDKTTFGEFILDLFSLPLAEIGSWIANKWKEYNLVSIFLNVAVEIPIVSFISFVESWRNFVKDKKADIH